MSVTSILSIPNRHTDMLRGRILVIEDDRALADVLRYNLRQAGFDVWVAYDGQDGLNQARRRRPDLVVLDLMLPVVDGLEVCKQLRTDPLTRDIKIVMLTAKSDESDEVVGFMLGTDDYVTKPFSVKVLLERIKALLRRSEPSDEDVLAAGPIVLDRVKFRVTAAGRPVALTRTEFRLLETLMEYPGRVFGRSELIESALGDDSLVLERTIDVHIRALRKKLGDAARYIETVRGVGYRFAEDLESTEERE
ncbi:MAG: DNA-binding response regulator [Pirellulaceae bacterium]|nr:MAG: DNA-binding response regulator [Pirellulaceae bacterium]